MHHAPIRNIGKILYYGQAINITMIIALGTLEADTNTQDKSQAITQLLNYCDTYPDVTIRLHCCNMCLSRSTVTLLTYPKPNPTTAKEDTLHQFSYLIHQKLTLLDSVLTPKNNVINIL